MKRREIVEFGERNGMSRFEAGSAEVGAFGVEDVVEGMAEWMGLISNLLHFK